MGKELIRKLLLGSEQKKGSMQEKERGEITINVIFPRKRSLPNQLCYCNEKKKSSLIVSDLLLN